jgi:hypothetical protein
VEWFFSFCYECLLAQIKTIILSPAWDRNDFEVREIQFEIMDNRVGTPKLLLLFGTPRSGTTWLGKIFDSHPLTLYKHEPDRSGFGLPFAVPVEQAEEWRQPVQKFIARLNSVNTAHAAARQPVFAKRYRSAIGQHLHQISVFIARGGSSLNWELPVWQCGNVLEPDVRLVWKSTDSLGRLGVILRALDNCRAIRIIRHPCGYIASVLRGEAMHRFVATVPTSEDYGMMQELLDVWGARAYGLTIGHMRSFHPVERMAWIWVLLNEKAERDTADDARCIFVRYEDVCRDPIHKAQALFSFCGLDWNRQTVDFIRASTLGTKPAGLSRIAQNSRGYYSIFRNPLQAAEKWRSEMEPEHIERVYHVVRQSNLIQLYPESEPAALSKSSVG